MTRAAIEIRLVLCFALLTVAHAQDPPKPEPPQAAKVQASEPAKSSASWKLDYFYDKDRSSLSVVDAAFVSPTKAILVGGIEEKQKIRSVIGFSSDAGKNWTFDTLKEQPVALFFLNEATGWLATQKSIQATSDGGRTWRRLNPLGGMRRLYFLDKDRGFAVGSPKAVFETKDGVRTPVQARHVRPVERHLFLQHPADRLDELPADLIFDVPGIDREACIDRTVHVSCGDPARVLVHFYLRDRCAV